MPGVLRARSTCWFEASGLRRRRRHGSERRSTGRGRIEMGSIGAMADMTEKTSSRVAEVGDGEAEDEVAAAALVVGRDSVAAIIEVYVKTQI